MDDTFERAKRLFIAGNDAFEARRFDDAEAHFDASLALLPARASTLSNLAVTCLKLGKAEKALNALDAVLAQSPPDAGETWFLRGQALQQLGRYDDAIASYRQAVALDPRRALAWSNLGGLLKDHGRRDEAADAYRAAIAHGGDAELNGYYLASVLGDAAPPAAPVRYVRSLFNDYADQFDAHLVAALKYRAHVVLAGPLAALHPVRFRSALDLGCGTGLCGPLVKPVAERLDGVDLSPKMLDKARALGVYDRLVEGEIVEHLQTTAERHDLVLCADVVIYIGELDPLFAGVRRVIEPGGVFCFSAEAASDDRDFVLTTHLRYAHSQRHLRELAARHGFEVMRVHEHPIREDQRRPIPGLFIYLRRP